MLHGSGTNQSDTFYRAFVPEIGSALFPRQIELVKRCLKSERGEIDRVGATIFPGLVKVTRPTISPSLDENVQTVVRRAQVICECAMGGSAIPQHDQTPLMPNPMAPTISPGMTTNMQPGLPSGMPSQMPVNMPPDMGPPPILTPMMNGMSTPGSQPGYF